MAPSEHPRLRLWRARVFLSTWLSYAGLYFCRMPFYIVKPVFTRVLGMSPSVLARVGTSFLLSYTAGQFGSAAAGSLLGARRLLLAGMTVSVFCNLAFGSSANYGSLLVFMAVNGLAQSTGWSGNVGTMAHWTCRSERGTVMGLWATCYQVGGVLSKFQAAFLLGWLGWRWSFFGGSFALGLVIVLFFFMQRNRPEDVGLPPLEETRAEGTSGTGAARPRWSREARITLLLMGGGYFCIKFIRYALWSWAAYFLSLTFGLQDHASGYLSTIFEVTGFLGVVSAGVASDRLFGSRRSTVAFLMLLGLTAACLVLWIVGGHSVGLFAVGLGLVGFMLYGPDSLLSGAGAIDLGSREGAIAAAGIINGMGSVGSVVQELVIGRMYERSGGRLAPIFLLLLGAAGIAALCVGLVLWRTRRGKSDL